MKNAILTILTICAIITVRADYEFSTITNAETGAKVTSKIIPDGYDVATFSAISNLEEQIDTESPLLARSFSVPQQSGWTVNQGSSSSPIFFRPRFFGMKDGDLFKGIVLRTRSTGRTPFQSGVYMRVKRYSDGQTLGVSKLTVWTDTGSTDVVFRFPVAVELTSSGNYYTLDFSETPEGNAVNFGMSLYSLPTGSSNPDFYFASSSNVPISTAQFYSWEELTGADIAVSGTDATKIDAALAGKATKADATLTERGFSEWNILLVLTDDQKYLLNSHSDGTASIHDYAIEIRNNSLYVGEYNCVYLSVNDNDARFISGDNALGLTSGDIVATRTALQGYILGPDEQTNPNRDKPLASEAEAEALRTNKLDKTAVVAPSESAASGQAAGAKATGDALAARPTKAEMDEGWLSEFSYSGVPDGVEVLDLIWNSYSNQWVMFIDGGEASVDNTSGEDALQVSVTFQQTQSHPSFTVVATRHRVAAPVPTKPDDIGAASTNDVQITPIYSDTPTFSEWVFTFVGPHADVCTVESIEYSNGGWHMIIKQAESEFETGIVADENATEIQGEFDMGVMSFTATRTRTDIIGYTLGSQNDKPLQPAGDYASRAPNPTLGNLAALDANGNPTDSGLSKDDVESLFFAQYYPDGSVKSAAEFTPGIKYDAPDTTNRTITVKPFCNTGTATNDNSSLVGRVVIPPFVDAQGNPYISDDGTRFKVVGVSGSGGSEYPNVNLTDIIAPSTVMNIGNAAFYFCTSLTTVSLPAATTIGNAAFSSCTALTTVSLPAATTIGNGVFGNCTSLTTVSLPAAPSIGAYAFFGGSLASVDFGDTPRSSVPSLGTDAFDGVPTSCKIIVPYAQYDDWVAADGWKDLPQEFVRHAEKADKPATFTTGNLAALDANGNPTDSGKKSADFATIASPVFTGTPTAPDIGTNTTSQIATKNYVDSKMSLSVATFGDHLTSPYLETDTTYSYRTTTNTINNVETEVVTTNTYVTSTVSCVNLAYNNVTQDGETGFVFLIPEGVSGYARKFYISLECGSTIPSIKFKNSDGSTATLVFKDKDPTTLVPVEGCNLYTIREITGGKFLVERMTYGEYSP